MKSGREAVLHGKQLRDRFFDVIAGPIFDDNGQISHVVMAYHDVTEARRVEQMKSEFVSTAAHELRTPLATIIGYADLLLSNPEQTVATTCRTTLKLIIGSCRTPGAHRQRPARHQPDRGRRGAEAGVSAVPSRSALPGGGLGTRRCQREHPIELDLPAEGARGRRGSLCPHPGDRKPAQQRHQVLAQRRYDPHQSPYRATTAANWPLPTRGSA